VKEGTFGTHCVDGDNIRMGVKEIVSESADRIYVAQNRVYRVPISL